MRLAAVALLALFSLSQLAHIVGAIYPGSIYRMLLQLNSPRDRKNPRTAPAPTRLWGHFDPANQKRNWEHFRNRAKDSAVFMEKQRKALSSMDNKPSKLRYNSKKDILLSPNYFTSSTQPSTTQPPSTPSTTAPILRYNDKIPGQSSSMLGKYNRTFQEYSVNAAQPHAESNYLSANLVESNSLGKPLVEDRATYLPLKQVRRSDVDLATAPDLVPLAGSLRAPNTRSKSRTTPFPATGETFTNKMEGDAPQACGGSWTFDLDPLKPLHELRERVFHEVIHTPGYGGPYPADLHCQWTLHLGPSCRYGMVVYSLQPSSIRRSHACLQDHLDIFFNGNRVSRYCGPLSGKQKFSGAQIWSDTLPKNLTVVFLSGHSGTDGSKLLGAKLELSAFCWGYSKTFQKQLEEVRKTGTFSPKIFSSTLPSETSHDSSKLNTIQAPGDGEGLLAGNNEVTVNEGPNNSPELKPLLGWSDSDIFGTDDPTEVNSTPTNAEALTFTSFSTENDGTSSSIESKQDKFNTNTIYPTDASSTSESRNVEVSNLPTSTLPTTRSFTFDIKSDAPNKNAEKQKEKSSSLNFIQLPLQKKDSQLGEEVTTMVTPAPSTEWEVEKKEEIKSKSSLSPDTSPSKEHPSLLIQMPESYFTRQPVAGKQKTSISTNKAPSSSIPSASPTQSISSSQLQSSSESTSTSQLSSSPLTSTSSQPVSTSSQQTYPSSQSTSSSNQHPSSSLSTLPSSTQPTSTSSQPTSTSSQPTSTSSQPKSTSSQPTSTSSQPKSTSSQPKSTSSRPKSTSNQPTSTSSQSTSTSNQPTSTSSQPTSTSSQPTSTSSQPTSTSSQPTSTSNQPTSTSSQPTSTSSQPTSTSNQPTSTSNQSKSTSNQPTSTPSQPKSTVSQPTSTSSQPTSSSSQPTSTSNLPTYTSSQPTSTSSQPTSTSNLPTSTSNLPKSSSNLPTPSFPDKTSDSPGPSSPLVYRSVVLLPFPFARKVNDGGHPVVPSSHYDNSGRKELNAKYIKLPGNRFPTHRFRLFPW